MAEPLERSLASAAGDKASGVGAPARTSWMRWAWVAGLSTAGSAIALIGAGYSLSGLLIRPRLKRLSQLKSPHLKHFFQRIGYPVEDVTFHSFDATRLSGWWLPVSSSVSSEASVSDSATVPSVVVLHGVKKNRSDVIRTGLVLRRAGFNVLMLDGRAHGNSGGRYVTYGYYECRDVEAALDWLVNEKKVARDLVGLAGESMGAAIALQAAAANPWLG
ncbi:MAG TPA: alpha/beta fold hydrolase, partial [Blastocatellia bacterium]|nr:alpha/beta fold hydrolase [Blastocatellia bacterium]